MANTVILKGGNGRYEEYTAAEAITPGMCVEMEADGDIVKGLLATGALCIALEDALQGGTVDTAYAAGDVVPCYYPIAGDVIQGYLKASQTIAIGAKCGWDADGVVAAASVGAIAETAATATVGDPISLRITGGAPAAS